MLLIFSGGKLPSQAIHKLTQKLRDTMLKYFLICFLVPFLCFSEDQLNREDIHKIMKQIFTQHVDKKKMSGEILANSFKTYFEQFDPQGLYLLQSEVEPFFQLSPSETDTLDKQYNQDNYSAYENINAVIQKAIYRARKMRKDIMQNPKGLYEEALSSPMIQEVDVHLYPSSEQELKEHIKKSIVGFLQIEIKRYGDKRIRGYEAPALALYEKQIQEYENPYLFLDNKGQPLSPEQKENVFTLHILKALAKSLDAHTAFFDAAEAYDMRVRLEKGFEGIGIAFQPTPQGILITNLIPGGPADKDGNIKVGDLLIEINGTKTSAISFEQAMKLLKGEKEEPIHLIFKRGEKEIDVKLKRETIVLNDDRVDVSAEQFGDGIIGRITLHSFYQNDKGITSEGDVRNAIKQLKAKGHLRGLILDLRENSGGFLSQAVKVAGLFITNGVVVISKYSNGNEKIYRDMNGRDDYDGPLIVLTSRATASAAEIVAEALQDYGVALVVGDEQTYGKGNIQSQTVTDNKGGPFFKVTVGTYYTVSGKTPQINGVKADVVVPGPYSQVHLGEEYLEHTIAGKDHIPPSFEDNLSDIDPTLRPWYLRYYMPTLQKRNAVWREEIPQLRKNSKQRLSNNKNYQAFLNLIKHKDAEPLKEELLDNEEKVEKNFGTSDLQLVEAINVLKDMIYLAPKSRLKEYMVGVENAGEPQETVK